MRSTRGGRGKLCTFSFGLGGMLNKSRAVSVQINSLVLSSMRAIQRCNITFELDCHPGVLMRMLMPWALASAWHGIGDGDGDGDGVGDGDLAGMTGHEAHTWRP